MNWKDVGVDGLPWFQIGTDFLKVVYKLGIVYPLDITFRKMTGSEKQLQAKGYKTASVVIRGGAAESILAAAKEYKPDITALGSRGLSGIEPILLGSVAERVVRYADCSVLIGRAAK